MRREKGQLTRFVAASFVEMPLELADSEWLVLRREKSVSSVHTIPDKGHGDRDEIERRCDVQEIERKKKKLTGLL